MNVNSSLVFQVMLMLSYLSFLSSLQVLFGTADGQVIVMDCHGRMLAHILLHESDGIVGMSWNFPSFQVEDSSESDTDSDDSSPPPGEQKQNFFCLLNDFLLSCFVIVYFSFGPLCPSTHLLSWNYYQECFVNASLPCVQPSIWAALKRGSLT